MRRILSVLCILALPLFLVAQQGIKKPIASPQIVIPVVIHIIHNGVGQPVSMEQVNSQIEALNRDFNAENADRLLTPDYFRNVVANCGIRFELAKVDPAGYASTGVIYKTSKRALFGMDNDMKFSSKGGDDAWPRDHYLNIWVCSMLANIQGFTSKADDPAEVDGIVLNQLVFGMINKTAPFGLGRIAVHEAGHWLGLKHIWGDRYCGDDGIDDTPQQKSYNKGCPSGIIQSCGTSSTGDMYMNFMDLTNDACMYMFTEGQKKKMRSMFEPGNLRNPLLASGALSETGHPISQNPNNSAIEYNGKHISIWPVPAKGTISVDLSGIEDIAGKPVIVYNMAGMPLMSVPASGKMVTLNVSGLRSGQYLLKVSNSTAPAARFIKL